MGLDPGNRHNKIALKCQTRHMKSRSARLQTCLLRRFPLKGQGYRLRRADLFNFKAQRAQSCFKPHSPGHRGRASKTRRIRHAHPRTVIHKPGAYCGHNLRRGASKGLCQQKIGFYQHARTGAQGAKLRQAGSVHDFAHSPAQAGIMIILLLQQGHGQ